jgi:hypothetical protein
MTDEAVAQWLRTRDAIIAKNVALTKEVEKLRVALTEFVQWADDGEDDDGIVARGKAALAATAEGSEPSKAPTFNPFELDGEQ